MYPHSLRSKLFCSRSHLQAISLLQTLRRPGLLRNPRRFEEAMIRRKLKKEALDHKVYSNFRPISNLKFTSEKIEKAISYQLINFLRDNDLEESLQSAYKTVHSTETALVKVQWHCFSDWQLVLHYFSTPWPFCSFWHGGSQDSSAETLLSLGING